MNATFESSNGGFFLEGDIQFDFETVEKTISARLEQPIAMNDYGVKMVFNTTLGLCHSLLALSANYKDIEFEQSASLTAEYDYCDRLLVGTEFSLVDEQGNE